jgi:hypothetical protein
MLSSGFDAKADRNWLDSLPQYHPRKVVIRRPFVYRMLAQSIKSALPELVIK